jgi:hypothetical protein
LLGLQEIKEDILLPHDSENQSRTLEFFDYFNYQGLQMKKSRPKLDGF